MRTSHTTHLTNLFDPLVLCGLDFYRTIAKTSDNGQILRIFCLRQRLGSYVETFTPPHSHRTQFHTALNKILNKIRSWDNTFARIRMASKSWFSIPELRTLNISKRHPHRTQFHTAVNKIKYAHTLRTSQISLLLSFLVALAFTSIISPPGVPKFWRVVKAPTVF